MHWCNSRFFWTRFVPLSRGNERNEKWSGPENRRNETKRETENITVTTAMNRSRGFVDKTKSLNAGALYYQHGALNQPQELNFSISSCPRNFRLPTPYLRGSFREEPHFETQFF